jgi:hypothetical protein
MSELTTGVIPENESNGRPQRTRTRIGNPSLKLMNIVKYATCVALGALLLCGCHKGSSSAPTPMPVEEMPAAFTRAFEHSDKETQDQANRFLAAMQKNDVSEAFKEIQVMSLNPSLTEDQRYMLGRARMTTTQQLQSAVANGDTKSAEVMQTYISTR